MKIQSLTYELPPAGGGADFQIEFYNLGYVQNIAVSHAYKSMNVKWTNIVFRCVKHCDEPL